MIFQYDCLFNPQYIPITCKKPKIPSITSQLIVPILLFHPIILLSRFLNLQIKQGNKFWSPSQKHAKASSSSRQRYIVQHRMTLLGYNSYKQRGEAIHFVTYLWVKPVHIRTLVQQFISSHVQSVRQDIYLGHSVYISYFICRCVGVCVCVQSPKFLCIAL